MSTSTMSSLASPSFIIASSSTKVVLNGAVDSRREVVRREVTLPCQAVREHDFVLIGDRALDLSTAGMLVPIKRKVLTGESIIVSFQIPGMWIDVEATVARIIHGRRPGDDGLAAGLIFDRLSSSSRAAIAGFLHGRSEPLPRRGPLAALRRGRPAPKLADEASMLAPLASLEDIVADEEEAAPDTNVDALGILRAVMSAWQALGIA